MFFESIENLGKRLKLNNQNPFYVHISEVYREKLLDRPVYLSFYLNEKKQNNNNKTSNRVKNVRP